MSDGGLDNLVRYLYQITAPSGLEALCDQELLQRFTSQRDEIAFRVIARRHGKMVWSVCWRVLGQRQDAEDAYQATFMTLYRRAGSTQWRESIDGWLHHVAHEIATKSKVARERRRVHENRSVPMREENWDDAAGWELSEVVDKELTSLPEKYRSPLILCYLEGLTREQAAQRLRIPVTRLDRYLIQGREKLRARFEKQGMDPGSMAWLANLAPDAVGREMPLNLVEKTMEMVRILAKSNGGLETVGISTEIAMLVKGTMGVWSLKMKILAGVLFLSLVGAGVGVALHSSYMLRLIRGDQSQEGKAIPITKPLDDLKVEIPPRLDCYGDPLPPGALARGGTIRLRHAAHWMQGGVESVLFSPDGTTLFTAGRGNPIRRWDVATGQLIRQFGESEPLGRMRDTASAQQTVLSPNGTLLASNFSDGSLFLWDVATGKLLRQWHEEQIAALSFAADGKTLTAVCAGNIICVWEVATGLERQRCALASEELDEDVWFAFSPDGKYLVSVGAGKPLSLWDIITGNILYQFPYDKEKFGSTTFVAFSPDGRFLATACAAAQDIEENIGEPSDGSVHLWELATGREVRCFGSDKAGTWSVAFSPDGKILATGSGAGPIRLWDVALGKEIRRCLNYRSHVVSLAFSPDGRRLASGASMVDHTARVWDVDTGKGIVPLLGGHISGVQSLAFTPDGLSLISGGRDGRVGLWNAATGQERRAPLRAGDLHALAALMPGSKMIASVGSVLSPDGKPFCLQAVQSPTSICLWDAATGRKLREFPGTKVKADAMVLSPDGRALVTLDYTRSYLTATLWDVATGRGYSLVDGSDCSMPLCAAFSPNGKVVVLGNWGGFVTFWDIVTKKKIFQYQIYQGWVRSLAFAPDGQTLATAGSDTLFQGDGKMDLGFLNSSSIRLWRCAATHPTSLEEINVLPITRHIGLINYLTFSPNGKTLASAGQDGTVRLWETSTGRERRCFRGHLGGVCCLAFAPDGRRLASGSDDTTILIWDVTGHLDHSRLRPAQIAHTERPESKYIH